MKLPVWVVILLVLGFSGCGDDERDLNLPETSVLLHRETMGVVTVEYARLHVETNVNSAIVAHARLGDVVPILERTVDEGWLYTETPHGTGWAHRDDLRLYDNRAQAMQAREQLREQFEVHR